MAQKEKILQYPDIKNVIEQVPYDYDGFFATWVIVAYYDDVFNEYRKLFRFDPDMRIDADLIYSLIPEEGTHKELNRFRNVIISA